MKTKLMPVLAACAVSSICLSATLSQASEQPPPAHETRMTTCAQEAKGLKGEERQHFMSKCLKGNGAGTDHKSADKGAGASHLAGQQNRMKTCNAEAGKKDLHGDERKKFMSACLKG